MRYASRPAGGRSAYGSGYPRIARRDVPAIASGPFACRGLFARMKAIPLTEE